MSKQNFSLKGVTQSSALLLGLGLLVIAQVCFWADSEIWAVRRAEWLVAAPGEYALWMKPLFNALLYVSYILRESLGLHPMEMARFLFSFLGLASSLLVYLVIRNLTGSSLRAAFSVLLLISSTLWLERSYRVRSDLLASFIVLLVLYFSLSSAKRQDFLKASLWWIGVVVALLATPKSIYLVISLVPLLALFAARQEQVQKNFLRWGGGLVFGLVVAGGTLLLTQESLIESYQRALTYFQNTFEETQAGVAYLSAYSFRYYIDFCKNNPLFPLAFVLSLASFVHGLKRRDRAPLQTTLAFSVLVMLAFSLFHPQKLPFFITSYLPFFAIFIGLYFPSLGSLPWPRFRATMALIVLIGLTAYASRHMALLYEKHSNREQKKVSYYLQDYFSEVPKYEVYDQVGILPNKKVMPLFLGPGQEMENHKVLDLMEEWEFGFLLYVYKMTALEPELDSYLRQNYAHVGQGVFARMTNLPLSQGAHKMAWPAVLESLKCFDECLKGRSVITLRAYDASGKNLELKMRPAAGEELKDLPYQVSTLKLKENPGHIVIPEEAAVLKGAVYKPLSDWPSRLRLSELIQFDLRLGL